MAKKLVINFTNRWFYTLLVFVGILVIAVGVYALTPGTAPNPGHTIQQVAPPSPCSAGQYLQFDGTNWQCATVSGGGGGSLPLQFTSVSATDTTSDGPVNWDGSSGWAHYLASATCPAGYTVISGDCSALGFLSAAGRSANSYLCEVYTKNSGASVTAKAVCLNSTQLTGI